MWKDKEEKIQKKIDVPVNMKDNQVFARDTYGEINTDLVMKNPLLFTLNQAKGNLNEVVKEVYDPDVLDKVKKLSLSSTLKEEKEFDRKHLKKVSFLRFLKRPMPVAVDYAVRNGVFSTLMRNVYPFTKEFELTNNNNKYVEDEKILIDKEEFSKTQTDKIARKVLTKCNFYHEKNQNNNKNLKTGEGKLSITNGLTLNQFVEKHKLRENI